MPTKYLLPLFSFLFPLSSFAAINASQTLILQNGGIESVRIKTGGHVSVTGNLSAANFIGNGSGLTNLPASVPDSIVSGSSYVMAQSGGTVRISGTTHIGYGGTTSANLELGNGATGNRFAYIDFVGDTTYTDYGLRIIRENAGANTHSGLVHRGTGVLYIQTLDAAPILFHANGTERMRIAANGNIGIGVTNPTGSKLEVAGNISATGSINTTNGIVNLSTGGTNYWTMAKRAESYGGSQPNNLIVSYWSGSGWTQTMDLTTSGNVGIGTSTPSTKLHVAGTITADTVKVNAPVANNDAATKQYVDTAIAAAGNSRPTYMGITPSTYNGARSGIVAANSLCSAAYPGSRIMFSSDIYKADYSTVTPPATEAWIVCDVFGEGGSCFGATGPNVANCTNWNTNVGAIKGATFEGASGIIKDRACSSGYAFHCVKD